jgi:glycosyltransferase involved in cell wall biosynthesis
MERFSVLMPVYSRESPEYLVESLRSLAVQSRPADEILIVKDGPIGDALEAVIAMYSTELPIVPLQLAENRGLGFALAIGVENCKFEIIARMDGDDISVPERFERQVGFLETHPEVDAISATVREFNGDPAVCTSERRLPSEHVSILAFAKRRCPLNHMAVVFRKSAVLAAGNYQSRFRQEDYDLWVRMLMNGSKFHNLGDLGVLARCGNGMQSRRGGWGYLRHEASLFWHFRSLGFLCTLEVLFNVGLRVPVRLLPPALRSLLYRVFVRRSTDP